VLREGLGLFAQLRPVVVYPQLQKASTLRAEVVDGVDMMLVREISSGALGEAGGELANDEVEARSTVGYTKAEVERVASVALQVAERRSGRVLNLDKADAMSVSRFWRKQLHAYFDDATKGNEGIGLEHMFVDDFVREVILRPADFDTIVTSNLFGDIVAEVIAALAGPARIAPSVWVSSDGLGVYGPADIYNPAAYPTGGAAAPPSPIAMIRSASMMLRYALEEPAAADLIQQALRKTLEDVAADGGSGNAYAAVPPAEFGQTVLRSLQLMRQFEQVCPPDVCGE
jgi:3-isopropylmalate dehydrogenase